MSDLPEQHDVATIMILVYHMDQLERRFNGSQTQSKWVGTTDFEHDHRRVRVVVNELIRVYSEVDTNADFASDLRLAERHLFRCVQECQAVIRSENSGVLPDWVCFSVRVLSSS